MKPGQAVEPGALCASFLMTLLQSPEQMGKDLHSSDLLCSQDRLTALQSCPEFLCASLKRE